MKVCHVINSLNRGGAESHLLELIKAQLDKDISVTVLVIGKDNSEIFSIENNIVELDVPIFRLKGPRMFNLISYFVKNKKPLQNHINIKIVNCQALVLVPLDDLISEV